MKKSHALAREIQAYCAAHADAKVAEKYRRYFKEGYDAWGLLDDGNPFFAERRDEWLERYAAMGIGGFIEAGEKLFASGKYEEGAIAIRFLVGQRDTLDGTAALGLARWFEAGVRNWAHTDVICGELLAPLLKNGRLPLDALETWRYSPLRFQRRAVPVALLGLLPPWKKGERASPAGRRSIKACLDFIRPMMLDEERVVHQGLGWFLREAWKRDAETVEPFLLRHKDTAARLIFQTATERMTAAGKARFRAERKTKGARRKAPGAARKRQD